MCAVGTVGNSGCVLCVCREQSVCVVGTVGTVVVCCANCREQCLCFVGNVPISGSVLLVL